MPHRTSNPELETKLYFVKFFNEILPFGWGFLVSFSSTPRQKHFSQHAPRAAATVGFYGFEAGI